MNNGIEVTEVKVRPIPNREPGAHLQAFASVVFNGALVVNNIRIVKGKFGPFVSWPSVYDKGAKKGFQTVHPVTKALQEEVARQVLRVWLSQQELADLDNRYGGAPENKA